MICTKVVSCSLSETVKSAPSGKRAMFRITSGPDEEFVGQMVTFHLNHAELCITRQRVSVKNCSLHFVSFIDEKEVS